MKNIFILAMFIFSALSFNNVMSEGNSAAIPDIDGNEVFDNAGEKVGEVDRVANDEKGMNALVIIGLDDSQKEVAVPLSSIEVGADGKVSANLSGPSSKLTKILIRWILQG